MNAKKTAKELISKFSLLLHKEANTFESEGTAYFIPTPLIAHCALICIDEKIKTLSEFCIKYGLTGDFFKTELGKIEEIEKEIKEL